MLSRIWASPPPVVSASRTALSDAPLSSHHTLTLSIITPSQELLKMSKPLSFPAVTGGCFCGKVRYRILNAPLFCFACHCSDCQRRTGTAFACFASIESFNLAMIGTIRPKITVVRRTSAPNKILASCPECRTALWGNEESCPGAGILNIRIGTFDIPSLMEPDVHCFIDSKVDWVILPKEAKTCKQHVDVQKMWPKISLKRLDACIARYEDTAKMIKGSTGSHKDGTESGGEEVDGELEVDKTPTAQSPEEKESETDEEFEQRYQESEKVLRERLAKLTLRLSEQQKDKEAILKA